MAISLDGKSSSNPTTPALVRSKPRLDDPVLNSTWGQRTWLASACAAVLIALAKSIVASVGSHIWVTSTLACLVGYIVADLMSGIYHWGIDNYGDATTTIFGTQIEAFQGHHKMPWLITTRPLAYNLDTLAQGTTLTVLPIVLFCNGPMLLAFVGTFAASILFSQQFHAWSHSTKSKLPPIIVTLQDLGVLLSRSQHAAHHRAPYNSKYCIVSGIWNKFLDENKVFEKLEKVLFFQFGVRPRSWSDPSLEWIEESSAPSS